MKSLFDVRPFAIGDKADREVVLLPQALFAMFGKSPVFGSHIARAREGHTQQGFTVFLTTPSETKNTKNTTNNADGSGLNRARPSLGSTSTANDSGATRRLIPPLTPARLCQKGTYFTAPAPGIPLAEPSIKREAPLCH
jgi:hypothetical protein